MKDKLENLKTAWQEFQNFTGVTQVIASKRLGWAPATLGLYLNGRRTPTAEHVTQLANYLNVDPVFISDLPTQEVRQIEIIATTSGNKPPQDTKKILWRGTRTAIYCDVPLLIEGATLAIPPGVTLMVSTTVQPVRDARWPAITNRYWVVRSAKKIKMFLSENKPKARRGETVYHVTSALFI